MGFLYSARIVHCFSRGRDALDIMLFDQYANYVVQRLLTIAIDVYLGKRDGDKTWLERIAYHVRACSKNLQRYSSGKKILDMLAMTEVKRYVPVPAKYHTDFLSYY